MPASIVRVVDCFFIPVLLANRRQTRWLSMKAIIVPFLVTTSAGAFRLLAPADFQPENPKARWTDLRPIVLRMICIFGQAFTLLSKRKFTEMDTHQGPSTGSLQRCS